jgi:hypothetical protein
MRVRPERAAIRLLNVELEPIPEEGYNRAIAVILTSKHLSLFLVHEPTECRPLDTPWAHFVKQRLQLSSRDVWRSKCNK